MNIKNTGLIKPKFIINLNQSYWFNKIRGSNQTKIIILY